ncbi:hypothetical protein C5C29_04680 [Rathayibacter sp. AY1H2]|nr:hypothetical protein C5C29_04680 [Rathayibacter sp. AY1H2]
MKATGTSSAARSPDGPTQAGVQPTQSRRDLVLVTSGEEGAALLEAVAQGLDLLRGEAAAVEEGLEGGEDADEGDGVVQVEGADAGLVSYTHLWMPPKREVEMSVVAV